MNICEDCGGSGFIQKGDEWCFVDRQCPSCEGTGIPAATLAGLRDGSLVAVPREPTEAMIGYGGASHDHPSVFMGGPSHNGRNKARRIWAAMLAAAQEPGHD